jgi:hypothetical protein
LVVARVAQAGELRGRRAIAGDLIAHDERSKQTADQTSENPSRGFSLFRSVGTQPSAVGITALY